MASDVEKHQELLKQMRETAGLVGSGFDEAVVKAFEHVFEHLERLNTSVSTSNPGGDERPLQAGESPTLR